MNAAWYAPNPSHEWDGPVTDPSIAKPGFYVCRICKLIAPSPLDQPCLTPETITLVEEMRAARARNPEAWRAEVDLDDAFLRWLFDPATKPAAQIDAVDALSANAARSLLHRICYERTLERIRSEIGDAS